MEGNSQKSQRTKGAVKMNTTETARPFWRQGDIYFVKIDREPDFQAPKPVKTGVIARGEQTGHMHRASNPSLADGAALVRRGESMYLRQSRAKHSRAASASAPVGTPRATLPALVELHIKGCPQTPTASPSRRRRILSHPRFHLPRG